ncbi:MAG: hypothetical protein AAF997_00800 [Myxococcota bacterium]
MRTIGLLVAVALAAAGCGDSGGDASAGGAGGQAGTGGDAGSGADGGTGGDDPGSFEATLEHTFDPIPVESGAEAYWCQSWTLDNDEPLYVNRVRQINDGGWHHSNWFFVPDNVFGEDGTWRCSDRDFGEVQAAARGGVIFAQSTQTFEEIQAFPRGTAIVVPPRSRIIGNVHLFNVSAAAINSSLTMGLQSIQEDEVEVKLREVSFANYAIQIPPQRTSRWSQTCDLTGVAEESFNIYYVLGHYHEWGNYFKLSFVDDALNEQTIVEFGNTAGDTLGVTIDPPLPNNGAMGLRYECGYNNTTDRTLVWGNNGQEEMCQFLAYIDGNRKIASFAEGMVPVDMGEDEDGNRLFDTPCGNAPFFVPQNN